MKPELSRHMIRHSGFTEITGDNPDGDIAIGFSGLRLGEVLYEELLIGDNVSGPVHPLIFKTMEDSISWPVLKQAILQMLELVEEHDYLQARTVMQQYVSGFTPDSVLVDWLSKSLPVSEVESKVVNVESDGRQYQ